MEKIENITKFKVPFYKRKALMIPTGIVLALGLVAAAYTLIFSVHIYGVVNEPISGSDVNVILSPLYTGQAQNGSFVVTNKANVPEMSIIDWLNLGNTNNMTVEISLDNITFVNIANLSSGYLETWQPGANNVTWVVNYTGNSANDKVMGNIQVNSELQSTPLVNVTYQVLNDPDSGNGANWALENFTRNLVIYNTSTPNTYFVVATDYNGTWQTYENLKSPEENVNETSNLSGSMVGYFEGTLTTTKPLATIASPGIMDMQGYYDGNSINNVNSSYTSWINYFFPGTVASGGSWSSVFNEPAWSWTYISSINNSTWVNAVGGDKGDITA